MVTLGVLQLVIDSFNDRKLSQKQLILQAQ